MAWLLDHRPRTDGKRTSRPRPPAFPLAAAVRPSADPTGCGDGTHRRSSALRSLETPTTGRPAGTWKASSSAMK